MSATHTVHDTIGLAFDFDLTLAPGSVDTLLDVLGIDRGEWRSGWLDPLLEQGWDEILARGYALIGAAKANGMRLDSRTLAEAGRRIQPYPGVTEMFDRLRQAAEQDCPGVRLDFTILSSGFADIIVETALAQRFDRVWGSAFHCDEDGAVVFVKRTITHPEKALYLAALVKGLEVDGANAPAATGRKVEEADMRFPVDQLIYVGDGASDLEAFGYVEGSGGLAIAVSKDGGFAGESEMLDEQRVENLAEPNFSDGGQMLESLVFAVRSAAARVALRRLSHAE